MRLPFLRWKNTIKQLGYRVVDRWNDRKFRDSEIYGQSTTLQAEELEPRQMLNASFVGFGLQNDTGQSNTDLITSDPTVTGTVDDNGFPGYALDRVEFDNYGDGSVDHGLSAQYDSPFVYDPRTIDPAIANHTGPFTLKYRMVQKDFMQNDIFGSWQTFNFEIQEDVSSSINVLDKYFVQVADDSGQVFVGRTVQGDPLQYSFLIQNSGDSDLNLDVNSLSVPTGFSVVSAFDPVVVPNSSTTLTIQLDATNVGPVTGELSFDTDDPLHSTFNFNINGDVELSAPEIEIRSELGYLLDANSNPLHVQTVQGVDRQFLVTIHNFGNDDLVLDLNSISLPTGFSVVSLPSATIPPAGGFGQLILEIDATTVTTYSGTFSIDSNDSDESTYTFDLDGTVYAASTIFYDDVTTVQTATQESGQGSPIVSDPRIKFKMGGNFGDGYVSVGFDHDGDGVAEGWANATETNIFYEYDPRLYEPGYSNTLGERVIAYKYVLFDETGVMVQEGEWSDFNLFLETDTSLGDLTIDHFGLINIDVSGGGGGPGGPMGQGDPESTTPVVAGVVNGTIGAGHVEIEFKHNGSGTVAGVVEITESGQVFSYDMREFDAGLVSGDQDLEYRLVKYDENDNVIDSGNWGLFEFELLAAPAGDWQVTDLEAKDGIDDGMGNISTDTPTITGTVTGTSGSSLDFEIELDFDNDGNVDKVISIGSNLVSTDAQGAPTFEYSNWELTYTQHTIGARVRYFDSTYGVFRNGPWATTTFTLNPAPAPAIESFELIETEADPSQSQGGTTPITVPVLEGYLDKETGDVAFIKVEFSFDTDDNTIEDATWSDIDGRFVLNPEDLPEGENTIRARTARYDAILDAYVYGDWVDLTFDLSGNDNFTIADFGLLVDDGSDTQDDESSDRRLRGKLVGDGDKAGITIEFKYNDVNGDVDATTTTDFLGQFVVDPTGLNAGNQTVYARTAQWNEYTQEFEYGTWESYTFDYVQTLSIPPTIASLGIKYDNDDTDGLLKTYNPIIVGSVTQTDGLLAQNGELTDGVGAYSLVEIDLDGDEVSDDSVQADALGKFEYYIANAALGSITIKVRARIWDYDNAQYVFNNWTQLQFTLEENISTPATLALKLLSDTGVSQVDEVTSNKMLTGTVTNESNLGGLVVEFDEDGNHSTIEGAAFVNGANKFYYDPGPYSYGSVNIYARAVGWDYVSKTYLYGDWELIDFVYVSAANAAPVVTDFKLKVDDGTSNTDQESTDATIVGQINNEKYLGNITVEIDIDGNGTMEYTTTTNATGQFEYVPLGLATGGHTIKVRAREIDYLTGNLIFGSWTSISMTLVSPPTPAASLISEELHEDTGNDSDGITSNPTISGTADLQNTPSDVVIQFDHDGDGVVDGQAQLDEQNSFEYTPIGLDLDQQHTIKSRMRWIDDNGFAQYSTWSTGVTYTLQAVTDDSMRIDNFGLVNDTGTTTDDMVTSDPTVTGTIVNPEISAAGLLIQLDINSDGVPEVDIYSDSGGSFTYTPQELQNGYQQIAARIITTDIFGLPNIGNWTTTDFILHDDPDGTEAQAMLADIDQYRLLSDANKTAFNNATKQIDDDYREQRQLDYESYQSAIQGAHQTQQTANQQHLSTYTSELATANQQLSTDIQNALSTYQNSLNGEEFYELQNFELPATFATIQPQVPGNEDLPLPPLSGPVFSGELHDLSKDAVFQDADKLLDQQYQANMEQAKSDLRDLLQTADNTFESQKDLAYANMTAAKVSAFNAYLAALKDYEVPTYPMEQGRALTVNMSRRNGESEIENVSIEQYYADLLAALPAPITQNETTQMGYVDLNFLNQVSDINKQKAIALAIAGYAYAQIIAPLQEQFDNLAAQIKLHEKIGDGNPGGELGELAIHVAYLKQLADIEATKDKAIAAAEKVQGDSYINAYFAYDTTSANEYQAYTLGKADIYKDAFIRRAQQDSGSAWWAYQLQLADNLHGYFTALATAQHTLDMETADALKYQSEQLAQATLERAEKIADANAERKKSKLQARLDFQIAEAQLEYDRQVAVNESWKNFKIARALVKKNLYTSLAEITYDQQIRDNQTFVTEWYILNSTATIEEKEQAIEDAQAAYAWSAYLATEAKADAYINEGGEYSDALQDYHNSYYQHELDFVKDQADSYSEFETTIAETDYGQYDQSGVLDSNNVGFFNAVAQANADLLTTIATENETSAHSIIAATQTFSNIESGLNRDLSINDETAKKDFYVTQANSYVGIINAWDAQIDTDHSESIAAVALREKDRQIELAQARLAKATDLANAAYTKEIAKAQAVTELSTDQETAQKVRNVQSVEHVLDAVKREQSANFIYKKALSEQTTTSEKLIADIQLAHQQAVAENISERQDSIDQAHWNYLVATGYDLYLRKIETITQTEYQSRESQHLLTKIVAVGESEDNFVISTSDSWETAVNDTNDEKVALAEQIKSAGLAIADAILTSELTLAVDVKTTEDQHIADIADLTKQYKHSLADIDKSYRDQTFASEMSFSDQVAAVEGERARDVAEAADNFLSATASTLVDEVQAAAGPSPMHWQQAHIDAAQGAEQAATNVATARADYHEDLQNELDQQTVAQQAAATTAATGQSAALAAESKSIADAEESRHVSVAQGLNEYSNGMDEATAELAKQRQVADLEFQLDVAKADRDRENAIAAANTNHAQAMSNKRKQAFIASLGSDYSIPDSEILTATLLTDPLKEANRNHIIAIGAAQVKRVTAHGDAMIAASFNVESTETDLTSTTGAAYSQFESDEKTAVDLSTGTIADARNQRQNDSFLVQETFIENTGPLNLAFQNALGNASAIENSAQVEAGLDFYTAQATDRAQQYQLWATSEGTQSAQREAHEVAAYADWLNEYSDDYLQYVEDVDSHYVGWRADVVELDNQRNEDLLAAAIDFQDDQGVLDKARRVSKKDKEGAYDIALATAKSQRATEITNADNKRFKAYIEASKQHAIDLANHNKDFYLAIFDEVNENVASEQLQANRASANEALLNAQEAADKQWRIDIALANDNYVDAAALAAYVYTTGQFANDQVHDSGLQAAKETLRNAEFSARQQHGDGVLTSTQAMDTAVLQSEIALQTGNYSAQVTATGNLVTATSSADWAVFNYDRAQAYSSWWSTVQSPAIIAHHQDVQLDEAARQTSEQASDLQHLNAINTALNQLNSEIAPATATVHGVESAAGLLYAQDISAANKAYIEAYADALYQLNIARNAADKWLALGLKDGQTYSEVERNADYNAAQDAYRTASAAAESAFDLAYDTAVATYQSAVAAGRTQNTQDLTDAVVDQQEAYADAQYQFEVSMAQHEHTFLDAIANSYADFHTTTAQSYANYISGWITSPASIRHKLEAQLAQATADFVQSVQAAKADRTVDGNQAALTAAIAAAEAKRDRIKDEAYALQDHQVAQSQQVELNAIAQHQAAGTTGANLISDIDRPEIPHPGSVSVPPIYEAIPESIFGNTDSDSEINEQWFAHGETDFELPVSDSSLRKRDRQIAEGLVRERTGNDQLIKFEGELTDKSPSFELNELITEDISGVKQFSDLPEYQYSDTGTVGLSALPEIPLPPKTAGASGSKPQAGAILVPPKIQHASIIDLDAKLNGYTLGDLPDDVKFEFLLAYENFKKNFKQAGYQEEDVKWLLDSIHGIRGILQWKDITDTMNRLLELDPNSDLTKRLLEAGKDQDRNARFFDAQQRIWTALSNINLGDDIDDFLAGVVEGLFVDGLYGDAQLVGALALAPYHIATGIGDFIKRNRDDLYNMFTNPGETIKKIGTAGYDTTLVLGAMFSGDTSGLNERQLELYEKANNLVQDVMLAVVEGIAGFLNDKGAANALGRVAGMILYEVLVDIAIEYATVGIGTGIVGARLALLIPKVAKFLKLSDEAVASVLSGPRLLERLEDLVRTMLRLDSAKTAAKPAAKTYDEIVGFLQTQCFTRDTLVSTEDGLEPIGEVKVGQRVHSFDFDSGIWILRTVTDRIDSDYQGAVLTIQTGDQAIETTVHHPFWVVEGQELHARSTPRKLHEQEDEGKTLEGKWVNSHELMAGDVVLGLDGKSHRITSISQRYVESLPVSNLTIGEFHNYAVGPNSILVHNDALCYGDFARYRDLYELGEMSIEQIAKEIAGRKNAGKIIDALKKGKKLKEHEFYAGRRAGVGYGNIPEEHYFRYNRYLAEAKNPTLNADEWYDMAKKNWENALRGNEIERAARKAKGDVDADGNLLPKSVGVIEGGFIADLTIGVKYGVTDVKDWLKISSTDQLKGFFKHAEKNGLTFNLIITPRTRSISGSVLDMIRDSKGKVEEFVNGGFREITIGTIRGKGWSR